jgi:acyl carrier protein
MADGPASDQGNVMDPMQARQVVLDALRAVAPEADLVDLDPGADVADELDLDSIDFLNVVTELSRSIGTDIPEQDYPKLATLDGFVAYVVAVVDPQPAEPAP